MYSHGQFIRDTIRGESKKDWNLVILLLKKYYLKMKNTKQQFDNKKLLYDL